MRKVIVHGRKVVGGYAEGEAIQQLASLCSRRGSSKVQHRLLFTILSCANIAEDMETITNYP